MPIVDATCASVVAARTAMKLERVFTPRAAGPIREGAPVTIGERSEEKSGRRG